MSAQDPDSDLSRLNRESSGDWVGLHPWTEAVLDRALFWAEVSHGAFDPTVSRRGWRDVALSPGRARLGAGRTLCFDGIAKGFAVDRAVEAMIAAGATEGLVNAGGDLRGFGDRDWTVEVPDPITRLPIRTFLIRDQAAATSAVAAGGLSAQDRARLPGRMADIFSATVVTASAMDADALTKIALADAPRLETCLEIAGARTLRLFRRGLRAEWLTLAPGGLAPAAG